METFYIFGFGVIFALAIVGVIYSVTVISKVKKRASELDELWEETEESISTFQTETERRLDDIDRDINDKLSQLYIDIEAIKSQIDSRFDRMEYRIKQDTEARFEEIESDIEQMQTSSQIMRESL